MKYICIFQLGLRCLLVARKENLTGVSTGLTGRSKNVDLTGNLTGASRPHRFPSLQSTIRQSSKLVEKTKKHFSSSNVKF